MNRKAFSVVLALCLGCVPAFAVTGTFYPIQPGHQAQLPAPAFVANFTVHLTKKSIVKLVLPIPMGGLHGSLHVSATYQGETFTGDLLPVFPSSQPKPAIPVPGPMKEQWDAVYGQGAYVGTVLGTGQDARGVMTGSKGTTIKVEIHTAQAANSTEDSNVGLMRGVAEDSQGQLYKIAF